MTTPKQYLIYETGNPTPIQVLWTSLYLEDAMSRISSEGDLTTIHLGGPCICLSSLVYAAINALTRHPEGMEPEELCVEAGLLVNEVAAKLLDLGFTWGPRSHPGALFNTSSLTALHRPKELPEALKLVTNTP